MRLFIIFNLIVLNLFSQEQEKDFKKHTLGSRFTATLLNTTDAHPWGKSNTVEIGLEPYYLYFFHENFSLGLMGEYRNSFTTLEDLELVRDLYGVGLISRFIYPIPNFIKNKERFNRFTFFGEASFSLTNYYLDADLQFKRPNSRLENQFLRIRPIGVNFDIYKGFGIDISFAVYKFFPGRWGGLSNIGFSFKF